MIWGDHRGGPGAVRWPAEERRRTKTKNKDEKKNKKKKKQDPRRNHSAGGKCRNGSGVIMPVPSHWLRHILYTRYTYLQILRSGNCYAMVDGDCQLTWMEILWREKRAPPQPRSVEVHSRCEPWEAFRQNFLRHFVLSQSISYLYLSIPYPISSDLFLCNSYSSIAIVVSSVHGYNDMLVHRDSTSLYCPGLHRSSFPFRANPPGWNVCCGTGNLWPMVPGNNTTSIQPCRYTKENTQHSTKRGLPAPASW